jgi:lysophospholipase L1-like esterase
LTKYNMYIYNILRSSIAGLLLLMLLATSVAGQERTPVPPNDPKLHYVGRFDQSNPNAARAQWSNSSVVVRFKGTGLSAKLGQGENDFYQVVVDGTPTQVVAPENRPPIVPLAMNLPDAEHVVELLKRTEASQGTMEIQGFEVAGELLQAQPKSRRIEVIGDSITCGYGNEAANENIHFEPKTENGYLAYGAIAARAVGAEYHGIAWSGRKMWPDNTIPEIYDTILPNNPPEQRGKWDFSKWQADVVLINLATNDFGQQPPDEKQWCDAYVTFVKRVRANYPTASIYLASGSMMSDNWPPNQKSLTTLKRYLSRIEAELKQGGETKIAQIHFDPQNGQADGLGADWHPSVKTMEKMAAKFVEAMERDLGWKTEN